MKEKLKLLIAEYDARIARLETERTNLSSDAQWYDIGTQLGIYRNVVNDLKLTLKADEPEGNWIRKGSKVNTRHGIAKVTGIEDTTRSRDPKYGDEVSKFNLDGVTSKGKKRTAVVSLDNGHYTTTYDGITVLEY